MTIYFVLFIQIYFMYNSFLFRKQNTKAEDTAKQLKKTNNWLLKYRQNMQPTLLHNYNKRANNFIQRVEENKNECYEYRQITEERAKQALKEIEKKQRFLGDAKIKLRDRSDWTSFLSATEKFQRIQNEKKFQQKYGDATIAIRSIASQSQYYSSSKYKYRERTKDKQIHNKSMIFNLQKGVKRRRLNRQMKNEDANINAENKNKGENHIGKSSFRQSKLNYDEDGDRSQITLSMGESIKMFGRIQAQKSMKIRQQHNQNQSNSKHQLQKKVYFKHMIDLQQNSNQKQIKKSLQQILVRFGIAKMKGLKKQAMAQTDNLGDQFF